VNCLHVVKKWQNFCQRLDVNPAPDVFTGVQNDAIVDEEAT
jgi:hypothetical protein